MEVPREFPEIAFAQHALSGFLSRRRMRSGIARNDRGEEDRRDLKKSKALRKRNSPENSLKAASRLQTILQCLDPSFAPHRLEYLRG